MSDSKRRYFDVMLGVFVALGIALLVVLVFVLGKERRLFDSATYLNAKFPNVAGLDEGAQVLLAGVVVGHVGDIRFPSLQATKGVYQRDITVVMRISSDMVPWIRKDSVVRIDSKGLLGDKTINIALGSPELPPVQDGDLLDSVPPVDLNDAMSQAQVVLENITESAVGVRKFMDNFLKEGGDIALAQTAQSLKKITKEIETGEGLIHQIIYSEKGGDEFNVIMTSVRSAVESVNQAVKKIAKLTADIENGQGLIHSLVYDPKGAEVIGNANVAMTELVEVLDDIRVATNKVRGLVDSGEGAGVLDNIEEVSKNINIIVEKLKRGEGTMGRLLVDPSVYDDLKLLLGNVRRNGALKALIRYGISRKEKEIEVDSRN